VTDLGPVSRAALAEVQRKVRQRGVLVWLDPQGDFSPLVDALVAAGPQGPFPVVAFRGSLLETVLALHEQATGPDPVPLLVHLPGFTRERVLDSPLLEIYRAGVEHRPALDSVIREAAGGKVPPDDIEAFLAAGPRRLADADAWLDAALHAEGPDPLRDRSPVEILDALVGRRLAVSASLVRGLERAVGLGEAWRARGRAEPEPDAPSLAFALAAYAQCVEYVHDLSDRQPVAPILLPLVDLPKPVVATCRELADHLRRHHPELYREAADEAEGWLPEELATATAADLGRIDTFRFEEDTVLVAALAALDAEAWGTVREWAGHRLEGSSFWLGQTPARRHAWELVAAATALGQALAAAGPELGSVRDLDEAVGAYVRRGAGVDRAHRQLEELRTRWMSSNLPHYEALRARLDQVRRAWRHWADLWAEQLAELYARGGFLPSPEIQQRNLFEQVVRPLADGQVPTALFMVDALRFEMAGELLAALEGQPGTTVRLDARLAELPTVTAVGMNALAPVAEGGQLRPALAPDGSFKGFHSGEFLVHDPDGRRRAMHRRVGGIDCPQLSLQAVLDRAGTALKQTIGRAHLVVVHSEELDKAGEVGMGPRVFPQVLAHLRHAREALHAAGVQRFVFTSDHGFLLLDETTGSVQAHGRRTDPQRRHVVLEHPADHVGQVRVSLADLGYRSTGGHLSFPRSTAVFDRGKGSLGFVHGGPSFQERVIPVLTVLHRAPSGSIATPYELSVQAREGLGDMHCLGGTIQQRSQGALPFGGSREVALALRVSEVAGVEVELCDRRGAARLEGGQIHVQVGKDFEVFFRLFGPTRDRVKVELFHPGTRVELAPTAPEARFAVRPAGATTGGAEPRVGQGWLDELDELARPVFAHLDAHGSITEREVADLLGHPRKARRFGSRLGDYLALAPFGVRVEVIGEIKRYVREERSS
jgi:hypothetical protein